MMPDAAKEGTELLRVQCGDETIVLRYPRWSDVREYLRLEQTLTGEKIFTPLREWTLRDACERLSRMLTDTELGRSRFVFADAQGRIVGRGSIEPYHGHGYGVLGIAIVRAYQRRGIGRAIMRVLEEQAQALGFRRIYLDVWAVNKRARALYQKMGFVEVGRRPEWIRRDDLPGGTTDLIEMVKFLEDDHDE